MILTYLCKDLRFAAWRRKQILKFKNNNYMKKFFTTLFLCAAVAVQAQQLPNGGFDGEWVDCVPWTSKGNTKTKGVQPKDWTISHVIGMGGTGATEVGGKQEGGYNGSLCAVKLVNTANPYKSSEIVPAYMTLGTTWATSKGGLYDSPTNKDGGTFGGLDFAYRPDALRFCYQRSHGTGNASEAATVCAYMWKGSTSQASVPGNNVLLGSATTVTMVDRDYNILGFSTNQGGAVTKSDDFELVASMTESFGTSDVSEWTEFIHEFDYKSSSLPEKINVIISANDYMAGGANVGENNILLVDDVALIYYSRLSSIVYDGVECELPEVDGTLDLSDQQYDEAALNYAVKGQSAEGVHWYDEESALLTIAVSNVDADVDGNSNHTYYVQFAKSQAPDAPQPEVVEYTNDLMVSINGLAIAPQSTTIQLIKELDGTTSFALNNFVLADLAAIGNIKLTNVTVNEDGTITAEQSIVIEEGNDPAYNGEWIGHLLGEVPVKLNAKIVDGQLVADIDIDMTETLGEVIKVTFAPTVVYEDGSALQIIPGLKNVVLNRSFKAGWRTLCLPFDFNPLAFGEEAVDAIQEFTGADANTLYFSEVAIDGVMKANVPYLVNFAYDVDAPVYFGADVQENAPIAVEFGDWRFVGTYEGIAAPGMNGLYGVTEVIEDGESYQAIRRGNSEASINATRAYFVNVSGTYMQKSMRIDLDGNTTAIGCIKENETVETVFPADVYSLDGRLVRVAAENLDGLAKGVYVVNGRKVVVK